MLPLEVLQDLLVSPQISLSRLLYLILACLDLVQCSAGGASKKKFNEIPGRRHAELGV
jgi:hypothetical protein